MNANEEQPLDMKRTPGLFSGRAKGPYHLLHCGHCGRVYRSCDLGQAERANLERSHGCPSDDCPAYDFSQFGVGA